MQDIINSDISAMVDNVMFEAVTKGIEGYFTVGSTWYDF